MGMRATVQLWSLEWLTTDKWDHPSPCKARRNWLAFPLCFSTNYILTVLNIMERLPPSLIHPSQVHVTAISSATTVSFHFLLGDLCYHSSLRGFLFWTHLRNHYKWPGGVETWWTVPFLIAGVPSLQDLMPDDLRWNWCNNNRNKVHNKCYTLESSRNHPHSHPAAALSMEKLSSTKLVPGVRKVGHCSLIEKSCSQSHRETFLKYICWEVALAL